MQLRGTVMILGDSVAWSIGGIQAIPNEFQNLNICPQLLSQLSHLSPLQMEMKGVGPTNMSRTPIISFIFPLILSIDCVLCQLVQNIVPAVVKLVPSPRSVGLFGPCPKRLEKPRMP